MLHDMEGVAGGVALSRLDTLITDIALVEGYGCPCDVVIADDPDGALLQWALQSDSDAVEERSIIVVGADLRQAQRAVEVATALGARERVRIRGIDGPVELGAFLDSLSDVSYHFVLGHLPKANEELAYVAGSLVAHTDSITLVLGGNTKHMVRTQNDVLARYASEVRASRGSGKFRCLIAQHSGPALAAYESQKIGRTVAFGGTFSGAKADFGGQFLSDCAIADLEERYGDDLERFGDGEFVVLDFGSGNGSVSRDVLAAFSGIRVIATDIHADAAASSSATLAAAVQRGRAHVTWDDGASQVAPGSIDVVLLNPPFHEGTRVDPTMVQRMLDSAHRVLRDGGSLYLVHNSHLRYRPEVDRRFGGSRELARNSKFTVLRADKR